jgi:hypothetical protein
MLVDFGSRHLPAVGEHEIADDELEERRVVITRGEAGDIVAVHQVLAVAMEREDIAERPENFLQVGERFRMNVSARPFPPAASAIALARALRKVKDFPGGCPASRGISAAVPV